MPAPLARRWRTPDAQAVTGIAVQNRPVGRCTMFGSAAFCSVQAIIRAADGAAAATVPPPASDHDAPAVTRDQAKTTSILERLFAMVRRGTGGAPRGAGQGRRRLGSAAQAD
jgi:hypothetical protein